MQICQVIFFLAFHFHYFQVLKTTCFKFSITYLDLNGYFCHTYCVFFTQFFNLILYLLPFLKSYILSSLVLTKSLKFPLFFLSPTDLNICCLYSFRGYLNFKVYTLSNLMLINIYRASFKFHIFTSKQSFPSFVNHNYLC